MNFMGWSARSGDRRRRRDFARAILFLAKEKRGQDRNP
jgi:hypothetical protein